MSASSVPPAAADGIQELTADLSSVDPVSIPATGPWIVDWSNLTRDGAGSPLSAPRVSHARVAFYAGLTAAELEDRIPELEIEATSLWEIPVQSGTRVDLAQAAEAGGGTSFPGFGGSGDGIWLFTLLCDSCMDSIPLVLAILEPT